MGTNYIAPMWRMPENTNKDKLSNYNINWDNTDQGISTAPLEDFGIDNTFSFSLWAKPNSDVTLTSYAHLFSNAALNSGGFGLYMAGDGNDAGTSGDLCFRFYVDNYNISGRFINSEPINVEQWYHIVVTYSDANGANMYIDNASPITGVENRTAAAPNNPVCIGSASNPVYGIRYQAKSSISEVCLFDYIINTDQIQYLYNLNNPMVIPGGEPVGYWRIGNNSNPLALAGYPNTSVGADSVFDFAPDSFINCGDINSVNLSGESAFSISCWFKSTSTSGGSLVTKSKNSANFDGYQLWLNTNGEVRFYLGSYTGTANTSPWIYIKSANQFNNGEWHNAVVTYNANQSTSGIKLYIDNVEQALNLYNNTPSVSSSVQNDFMIGARGNSSANGFYYTGEISNVQFWDAKLEASEVETLYNNGQPLITGTQPQAANLQAWYKLNQTDSYWDLGGNGKWTFNNAATN
tara:strand:+ start:6012 stop:7403 length:1392 start_codon:yes stop_codon:yes gene_type:complete